MDSAASTTGEPASATSRALERARADLERTTRELRNLIAVGVRLAAERDAECLCELVLTCAREMTWSEAGALYLVERDDPAARRLRLVRAQPETLPASIAAPVQALSPDTAVGRAVLTGEVVALADGAAPDAPVPGEAPVDAAPEYRITSMLVVPLRTPDGEVLGALQLLNRRADPGPPASPAVGAREAVPYTARSQDLMLALAAHGAVALENSRLYAELRAALRAAEESQQRVIQSERLRALGEMAGGVAHDFNNMLAVVMGRAQLLLRRPLDGVARRHVEIIEQAAQEAAGTVRRIQEFARMRPTRPFQRVDLNEVVREALRAARPRWSDEARARGIVYEVALELAPVAPVVGDPLELCEAVLSLLSNALDAMPAGGRVTLSTGGDGRRVHCTVADQGVGMTEEVRRRCFDPFFTTKSEHGTGLGLSLAYGIVTRHAGEIEVWSQPGRGSRFTVRLPAVAPAPPAQLSFVPEPAGHGARILVVEDDQAVREVVTEVLGGRGYCVVACGDGASALARLEQEPYDLVLLDLSMPGLSGWEVARRVRAVHPRLPIALITGWGDQIDPDDARARGIDYVVAKPFDVDQVAALVTGALDGAGRPDPARPVGGR